MPALIYSNAKSNDLFPLRVGATDFLGTKTFTSDNIAGTALVIKRMVGQTADISQWKDDAGVILTSLAADGTLFLNGGSLTYGYSARLIPGDATIKGLVIQGRAAQTGNLLEFQNSSGQLLANFSSNGLIIDGRNASVDSERLVIFAKAGQAQSLTEWRNSAGSMIAAINASGKAAGPGFARTTRVAHTFTISGEVKVPSGDTDYVPGFYVPVPAGQTVTAVKTRARVSSGSCQFQMLKDGVGVYGPTAVGTTVIEPGPFNHTFTDGQELRLVITQSSAAKNLQVTVYFDYTTTT